MTRAVGFKGGSTAEGHPHPRTGLRRGRTLPAAAGVDGGSPGLSRGSRRRANDGGDEGESKEGRRSSGGGRN